MRERHLFSVVFNAFTHERAFFSHLLSVLKSGSPHEHYLLLLLFPSLPTIPHPSVFYLSLFSGNFYSPPCTLPWFWVSLLSLLNVAETPTFTAKPTFGLPFSTSFFEKARLIASSPLTSSQAPISLHPLSDSSQEPCLLSLPVFPLSQSMAPKIHLETLAKTRCYFHLLLFPLICPVLKLCLRHGAPLQTLTALIAFFLLLQYFQQTIPEYASKNQIASLFSQRSQDSHSVFNWIQSSQSGPLDLDLILYCPTFRMSLIPCWWWMGVLFKSYPIYHGAHTPPSTMHWTHWPLTPPKWQTHPALGSLSGSSLRKALSTSPQHQFQLQILSQPATSWLPFFHPLRSSL